MSGEPQDKKNAEAPPPCPTCKGTGLNASRVRFCSTCLGSGKHEKRPSGWQ